MRLSCDPRRNAAYSPFCERAQQVVIMCLIGEAGADITPNRSLHSNEPLHPDQHLHSEDQGKGISFNEEAEGRNETALG